MSWKFHRGEIDPPPPTWAARIGAAALIVAVAGVVWSMVFP